MTKEQEEAIKYLEESILIYKNAIPKMSKAIETVLNILKQNSAEIAEKSAEVEKYKSLYNKALEDLVKAEKKNMQKDKIIDLMAERIEWLCKSNGILLDKEHDENFTQQDIKQYFERKSK